MITAPRLTSLHQKKVLSVWFGALAISFPCRMHADAALVLIAQGRSDYQVVLPDQSPTPQIGECLEQTARLVAAAFAANGAELAIVTESRKAPDKPALFLGNTEFARTHGISPAGFADWTYRLKAVGRDLIIVGNDAPAKTSSAQKKRIPDWDRVGTAKAAVDFLREFLGVRFLYPEIGAHQSVAAAAKIDFLKSPALEFLPLQTAEVPDSLDVQKTPAVRVNTAHPAGCSFYDLAHNRFPRIDELFGGHTWQRAVPPEQYFGTHPEYFALVNGVRLKPEGGNAQYCLSNSEVQELIYRDLASALERGFSSVDLGQPDGFRECQCGECLNLFGTGRDWGEKLWIFNRKMAERLAASHPGGRVTMMSYILTAAPPKSFTRFPSNTSVMLTGTNEDDLSPWRGHEVPGGFTGYLYNWCPNLGSRYTPMRTPSFVETQIRRLCQNKIQAVYRDGPGQLFGLEGPVYYAMGRMWDEPEKLGASVLVPEFCNAAFGGAASAMKSFYRSLYHSIALYSDQIGTRCDVWRTPSYDGPPVKTVQDPFRLLAFLYPPNLLESLAGDLAQAKKQADSAKVRTRLELIELEFEYIRHLARVVHLFHAFQTSPDVPSRDRLLDAIDARNTFVNALYTPEKKRTQLEGWGHILYPFPGHSAEHLRLAYDGYQEPFANTCFNWDTKAMRGAPMPGRKAARVKSTGARPAIDSPAWSEVEPHLLTAVFPINGLPRKTTVRMLHDRECLHVLAEAELEPSPSEAFKSFNRETPLTGEESFDFYLQPDPANPKLYRFMVGPDPLSRYDALNGAITDLMDPRYAKDDPSWNGEWHFETRVLENPRRWLARITIPFRTLNGGSPASGARWLANFARHHPLPRNKRDHAIWSSSSTSFAMEDRGVLGELVFD
jgi:hypothetical protein